MPYDAAAAVAELGRSDPVLAELMGRVGRIRLSVDDFASPYEALARSILFQQLTGRVARVIHERVTALGEKGFPTPSELCQLPEDALRQAGVSGAKVRALKDLADKQLQGSIPSRDELAEMDDQEIVERLVQIRGVGVWTVHMLLIFHLGRPDVLPTGDFGVRKGFARVYGLDALPTPAELASHGERWRPWRSVASWYMWRALEL